MTDSLRSGSAEVFDALWSNQGSQISSFSTDLQVRWFIDQRSQLIQKRVRDVIRSRAKILHCGCGTAQWSQPFLVKGHSVVNLDLSPRALGLTRDTLGEFSTKMLVQADVLRMPFSDSSFDAVMSFGLLEHFEDVCPVIQEMVRVLRPGGILYADIITARFSVRTLEALIALLICLVKRLISFHWQGMLNCLTLLKPSFYENQLSLQQYLEAMTQSGLKRLQAEGIRSFPFLGLPRGVERWYVRVLETLRRRGLPVIVSASRLALRWCPIWGVSGIQQRQG